MAYGNRLEKHTTFVTIFFLYSVKHGGGEKFVFRFWFDGGNYQHSGMSYGKSGTVMDHTRSLRGDGSYTFSTLSMRNFEVTSDKFKAYRALTTKFFTRVKRAVGLQNYNSMQYEITGFMKLLAFVGQLSGKVMSLYVRQYSSSCGASPAFFDNQNKILKRNS
jgi:hypothetical protein